MAQTAENLQAELEPPGRGELGLSLEYYDVPTSRRGLRRLVDNFASQIVAAYRGVTYPHPDHPDLNKLTRKKKDGAASGIKDAKHVVIARDTDTGEFAGLYAYTHHNSEDGNGFMWKLHLEGCPVPLSYFERSRVTNALAELRDNAFFVETNELVVPKERRGKGVSEYMRSSVYNQYAKELGKSYIVLLGDMKDASPVGQREKSGGITYWAGEIINPSKENLPFNLTPEEFKALSWVMFRAYQQTHADSYKNSLMDNEGIVTGGDIFELPVRTPKQEFSSQIKSGLTRLQEREKVSGQLCSAMGVTIMPLDR